MTRHYFAFVGFFLLLTGMIGGSASALEKTGASGLPLPRYVSLRSDKVNLRKGPGKDYGVNWVFKHLSLPVEIIAEYEHWRKIRDSQGSEGWVYYRLLSGRRTALVMPWDKKNTTILLKEAASKKSAIKAKIESGVMVHVSLCDGKWCEVEVYNISGWLPQEKLWGVYAGEKVE